MGHHQRSTRSIRTRTPNLIALCTTVCALGIVGALPSFAERPMDPSWEITALGGVGFGGEIDGTTATTDYQLSFSAAPLVHAMVGFRPYSDEGRVLLLSYQYQFSEVTIRPENSGPIKGDIGIGYLHAGGEIDGRVNDWVHPFFGMTIGATHYTIHSASSTSWFFSGGAHGGIKMPFGDHFGLRLQGRYIGTVISSDTEFLCTGGTCILTLNDVAGAHQGEFSGGVYFSF